MHLRVHEWSGQGRQLPQRPSVPTLRSFRPFFCTFSESLRRPTNGLVTPVVVVGSAANSSSEKRPQDERKNFLSGSYASWWEVLSICTISLRSATASYYRTAGRRLDNGEGQCKFSLTLSMPFCGNAHATWRTRANMWAVTVICIFFFFFYIKGASTLRQPCGVCWSTE